MIRVLTHGDEGAAAFCEQIADALVAVARMPQRSNPNQ